MIVSLRLRKIIRDLWFHKRQTALILLAIGGSVLSVSVLARTRAILLYSLDSAYIAARPPQVEITTHEPFDEEVVALIRSLPQVQAAEGMRKAWLRCHFGDELWRPLSLIARADYTDQKLNQIWPVVGVWPPTDQRAIWLERSALDLSAATVGDTIEIDTFERGQVHAQVMGLVYAPTALPSPLSATLLGYTTLSTLRQLTGTTGYNKLYLVATPGATEQEIGQVVTLVQSKLAAHSITVAYSERIDPSQHPLTPIIRTTMLILGSFGGIALLFSLLMVVHTLTGLLAQQTVHIGVMKALGFRHAQIAEMYLSEVALLGFTASALAVPVAVGATILFVRAVARQLNIDIIGYQVSASVYGLELLVGVLVPLLAALIPVLRSTGVTVRTAIQSGSSVVDPFGLHWLDQWLKRLRGLSPPWLYVLRNLLRRKVHLTLTLFTITLAGVIFIVVMSLHAALLASLAQAAAYWQQDVLLELPVPLGTAIVKNELLSIPGVVHVEPRLVVDAAWSPPDSATSVPTDEGITTNQELTILGVPPDTPFLQPSVLAGRWLHPGELNGLVINVHVLPQVPEIHVGQTVTLTIDGRPRSWQVVGLVTSQLLGERGLMEPLGYTSYRYLSESIGQGGLANQYLLETTQHDSQFQLQVARTVEDHLKRFKLSPRRLTLTGEMRAQAEQTFSVVVCVVQFALALFTIVGGLGLMSLMTLSVLERRREIGILRVLGVSDRRVAALVILEGVVVGLWGWSLAALLAWPWRLLLTHQVGMTLVQTPLARHDPWPGLLLWLAISLTLSLLATFLPARGAVRINVCEALRS